MLYVLYITAFLTGSEMHLQLPHSAIQTLSISGILLSALVSFQHISLCACQQMHARGSSLHDCVSVTTATLQLHTIPSVQRSSASQPPAKLLPFLATAVLGQYLQHSCLPLSRPLSAGAAEAARSAHLFWTASHWHAQKPGAGHEPGSAALADLCVLAAVPAGKQHMQVKVAPSRFVLN